MEKRDPLKEVGNTQIPDSTEQQEVAAKEEKIQDVVISSSTGKENEPLLPEAEQNSAERGLDVECGNRVPVRLSLLRTFDPLYSSPETPTVPQKRQQLIIEDSDSSGGSQSSPLPPDVSDDEAAFVDAAADSDDVSNKYPAENKHIELDESFIKFYTPEKFDATVVEHSVTPPTSKEVDTESVLPNVIEPVEPVSTSKSIQAHIEKRKLHQPIGKIHSPQSPIVPCKKQRFTETEIAEAVEKVCSKLQVNTDKEGEGTNVKNIDELNDSSSEVSEIKTDSLDRSQEQSSNSSGDTTEKHTCSLCEDSDSYPELPETSDEPSKALTEDNIVPPKSSQKEKADILETEPSCETYPDLPDTPDESSRELLVRETVSSKTAEEEIVNVSARPEQYSSEESYAELPETSDESSREQLVDKTASPVAVGKKTFDPAIWPLLRSSSTDSNVYSELPEEVSDKSSRKLSADNTSILEIADESVKLECPSADVEIYPELPETSHESSRVDNTASSEEAKKETLDESVTEIALTEQSPEKVSDEKAEKELINLSTKQKTWEEGKSLKDLLDQKVENVTEVDSNEVSSVESPKSTDNLEYSGKNQEKSVSDSDEPKFQCDGEGALDEVTKTITDIIDKIDSDKSERADNREKLKEEEKAETDSEKFIVKKLTSEIDSQKAKMADLSEKLSELQQENSDLKLQLNAAQQAKASLELEIRQKEEIIIKTQAEALKNEQANKQEIKQLREKLKENSKLIEKDGSKELEEQLKEAKARETKAIAELNQKNKDDLNYQKIMEEYENTIATRFADYQKLKEEHETATRHLANIELAFSDVHQKYERTKTLLEGYKSNEEAVVLSLQASEKTCKQHEERYESLKSHAQAQIEKSNKEILMLRDKYEMDINKLKAIIKRLEIKCGSLEVSLQQKTEECSALSALCDEVTGKRM